MRISDWSSDVCSSDLDGGGARVQFQSEELVRVDGMAFEAAERFLAAEVEQCLQHVALQPLHQFQRDVEEIAGAGGRIEHAGFAERSEEHTSELQSLMRISYAVFCLKKKKKTIIKSLYYDKD